MARVTVEDCILTVPDRFDLVMLASARAKQISSGGQLTVDRDNDKDAVVALREIAENTVDTGVLRDEILRSFSRFQRPDVIDDAADAKQQEIEEAFAEAKQHVHVPAAAEEDGDEDFAFGGDDVDSED